MTVAFHWGAILEVAQVLPTFPIPTQTHAIQIHVHELPFLKLSRNQDEIVWHCTHSSCSTLLTSATALELMPVRQKKESWNPESDISG
jgi:hypothetical protein